MAPFIPFPNGAQLVARYFQAGEKVENVFHFQGGATWTSTLLASLATTYASWETAHGASIRGTSTQLHEVYCVDLSVDEGQWDVSAQTIDGTDTAVQLPNNVTLAVKWITSQRGRSFRGRTYHIGLTEDMRSTVDPNMLSPANITAFQARYRLLLTATWPNSGVMCVASRRHNGAPRTTGVMTPITDCSFTDPVFDSARRRLPFHNIHR
jgi:hypothetical protein